MGLMPGIPYDPGASSGSNDSRRIIVRAPTLHRTIGTWPGDYSVGKNRVHSSPGTFNFLVGENPGQWVQFYPADVRCTHAAGGNQAGPGIEFSGGNGVPLTPWQLEAGGKIITWLGNTYNIPFQLHDSPRIYLDQTDYTGFINHRGITYPPNTSFNHYNFVYDSEFRTMAGSSPDVGDDEDMIYTIYILKGGVNAWVMADSGGYVRLDDGMFKLMRNLRGFGVKSIEVTVENSSIAKEILNKAKAA